MKKFLKVEIYITDGKTDRKTLCRLIDIDKAVAIIERNGDTSIYSGVPEFSLFLIHLSIESLITLFNESKEFRVRKGVTEFRYNCEPVSLSTV